MTATRLDGNRIADEIKREVAEAAAAMQAEGMRPGLAVILAGHNPASEIYVRNKVKACETLGFYSEQLLPPDTVSTDELLRAVDQLNRRDDIDGILVQLPLPPQVDAKRVLLAVAPEKDVDGFHPINLGNLVTQRPGPVPCTPAGIIEILKRSALPIAGRETVVVGRSDIVGKPVALLLMHENATVTVCHSRTRDLPAVCRRAEILIAAIGRPGMIGREYIRPGAVVIDVGINRLTSAEDVARFYSGSDPNSVRRREEFARKGATLVGDCDPRSLEELAHAYTPVPGGVGPLTIAMLMSNTLNAARRRRGLLVEA